MSSTRQGIAILGATGTIGVNTLDVISTNMDRYKVIALTANSNTQRLLEQSKQWQPDYVVLADDSNASEFAQDLKAVSAQSQLLTGVEGLVQVSQLEKVDQVMAGIVGAAGLLPSLAAAQAGKKVLLANKEALVMSGALFMDAVKDNGARLMPVDSEHNAIFQCLPGGEYSQGVDRIVLTASGGPFLNTSHADLECVTPEQACEHPNWSMGRKISVDSSTLMNKGLELIEACWLFNTSSEHIDIVIHPQSVVHSMVSYIDGSVISQMGNPDMRTPIAYAMSWPDRIASGVSPLDLTGMQSLQFQQPDEQRFPALRLAREACEAGGVASVVLNASNEVAVESFLARQIKFLDITSVVEHCLEQQYSHGSDELEGILAVDKDSRECARSYVSQLTS